MEVWELVGGIDRGEAGAEWKGRVWLGLLELCLVLDGCDVCFSGSSVYVFSHRVSIRSLLVSKAFLPSSC